MSTYDSENHQSDLIDFCYEAKQKFDRLVKSDDVNKSNNPDWIMDLIENEILPQLESISEGNEEGPLSETEIGLKKACEYHNQQHEKHSALLEYIESQARECNELFLK